MDSNNFDDKIFDALLKMVLSAHEQNGLDELNNIIAKEGKHQFSPKFEATMKDLIKNINKKID